MRTSKKTKYALRLLPVDPELVAMIPQPDGSVVYLPKRHPSDLVLVLQAMPVAREAEDGTAELAPVEEVRRITIRTTGTDRRRIWIKEGW